MLNRKICLAARPSGFPKDSDFQLKEEPLPQPDDGEFRVRNLFLSVDPYMRGRMSDRPSYAPPVEIGDVMVGGVVGVVDDSRHERYQVGDTVVGMFGWQEYATSDGQEVHRVPENVQPISAALHVLGMPGLTAYFGLQDICDPQAGETLVVSGAAGAVGSTVGQIGKIKGCRVVGVAGTDEKVEYITKELGFDAAFNYKSETDYYAALKRLCPDGIDAYFDNVGGEITDAVFPRLNVHSRVAICGQISQYNLERPEDGPRFLWHLITKRTKVQGFLVLDYAARYGEGLAALAGWLQEGRLKFREQVAGGIENAPAAFMGMLRGENIGKQLVKIAEP